MAGEREGFQETNNTDAGNTENTPTDQEYEVEARSMGWHPDSESWHGKGKWVDAKTFVENGRQVLPIINQQNRELRETVKRLEGTIKDINSDVEQFKTFAEKQAEAKYQALYAAVLERQAEAVASGDKDAFREASSDLVKLDAAKPVKEVKPAAATQEAIEPPPELKAWVARNQWYLTPGKYQNMAQGIAALLKAEQGLEGLELAEAVESEMKQRVPSLFPGSEGPNVESGGNKANGRQANGGRAKGTGYAALPPEAKAQCDRQVKNGWIKETAKDAWAKIYLEENS